MDNDLLDLDSLFDDLDLDEIAKAGPPKERKDPWIPARNKLYIYRRICLGCGTQYDQPGSHTLLEKENIHSGSKHAMRGFRKDLPTVHVIQTLDPVEACAACLPETMEES
jgi:hypothetical protein